MTGVAYKLVDQAEWAEARATGAYDGSAVDRADGYLHMSTTAQLAETARRHYAGRGRLVLVALDPSALGEALRWEPSRGGDLFPHLYGALPTSAVLSERALSVAADGTMIFKDGASGWP
jgi:uncharacterized protein (DUF952 family)